MKIYICADGVPVLQVCRNVTTIYSRFGFACLAVVSLLGLDEPKVNKILGPSTLELSQGDVLAGIISRADLAELAVELALSKDSNLRNTALEAYYTKGAVPCDKPFKDFLDNGAVARLHGDTYKELFSGIKPGLDYYEV